MKSSLTSILSDLSTINTLLETFCERLPQCYFVIDGLDECGEGRKEVLETFKNLVRQSELLSPGRIRVLFLSRPAPKIKNSLVEAQVLALQPEHTEASIRNYCRYRTRELAKFEYGDEVLNNVADRICTRADGELSRVMPRTKYSFWANSNFIGIFLFANLVMENLSKQPNRRRFKDEIDDTKLPSELNEA